MFASPLLYFANFKVFRSIAVKKVIILVGIVALEYVLSVRGYAAKAHADKLFAVAEYVVYCMVIEVCHLDFLLV
jgi:hypothetical protein